MPLGDMAFASRRAQFIPSIEVKDWVEKKLGTWREVGWRKGKEGRTVHLITPY